MTQHRKRSGRAKSPDLLLLAPCTKVIIDNDDNLVSLVDIFEGITVSKAEVSAPAPETVKVAPLPWHIFTLWKRADAKVEHFVQILHLVDPNGKKLFNFEQKFSTTHRTFRIRIRCKSFPVTVPGEYWVKVFIRSATAKRKSEVGRYPVNVTFSDESPSQS